MLHQQFGTPSPKSIKGVEHAASTSSLKQAPASQETLAIIQQSYNFQRYKKDEISTIDCIVHDPSERTPSLWLYLMLWRRVANF